MMADIDLHGMDTKELLVITLKILFDRGLVTLKKYSQILHQTAPSYFFRGKKKLQLIAGLALLFIIITAVVLLNMSCAPEKKIDPIFEASPLLTPRKPVPGPRILCVIGTYPKNFRTKLPHVIATWTGRCDSVVFITPKPKWKGELMYVWDIISGDMRYNLMEVAGSDDRNGLYEHLKDALIKILEQYEDTFDFIFKCDDDTYVIMENLKHRLAQFDPDEKMMMGAMFFDQNTKYLSGGAGTAISRAGVKAIVNEGLMSASKPCKLPVRNYKQLFDQVDDDIQLGECAKILNFKILSSEDEGHMTFFPFPLETHIISSRTDGWWKQHTLECRETPMDNCPSTYPVTFHYISPIEMYKLEYLLYSARLHNNQEIL